MARSIKIEGLDKLLKDLRGLGKEGEKRIAETTKAVSKDMEREAKREAPVDLGALRQSIQAIEIDKLNWKVVANATGTAPYAAFQEFGTGGLVDVPPELADVAIQFKGFTGKKIDMRPQPYMYPALLFGRKQYVQDLENDLEELTKNI